MTITSQASRFINIAVVENPKLSIGFLALIFTLILIFQTFYQWQRLRHIPGPGLASISKLWCLRAVAGGSMHKYYQHVSEKYGPLVRISPKDLITNDPVLLRRMFAARSKYRRSNWYIGMRFDPSKENVLSERDDDRHTALRAKMAAGYSGKDVEKLEETIDENLAALLKLLDSYVSNKKRVDLAKKSQFFTMDVLTHIAFGKPFGFLETDSDVYNYLKATDDFVPATLIVTVFPWLNVLLRSKLIKAFLPSEKDLFGFGKVKGVCKKVVSERFGPEKIERRDMLGSFISHTLTQDEAESETILQIVAGSDTTATAIRVTLLYLITSPRALSTLRYEIATSRISNPISDAEARQLPYLQAVIKEGLRVFPPVAGLMAKQVPPEGDFYNNLFIPGGTRIGYSVWGLFRSKALWGEDADVFRPERWLEAGEERRKAMDNDWELVFAGGKYQCLGRNIAFIELNKVFVEVLRRFDFAVVDPENVWKSSCNGIFSQSEMWMTVQRREKNS